MIDFGVFIWDDLDAPSSDVGQYCLVWEEPESTGGYCEDGQYLSEPEGLQFWRQNCQEVPNFSVLSRNYCAECNGPVFEVDFLCKACRDE